MPDLTQEERAEALRLAATSENVFEPEWEDSLLIARALLAAEARERELREALTQIANGDARIHYVRIARAALRQEAE